MIELMVAMLIMFTALLVMAYTMYTGLSTVGFSRQRTEATALANKALEAIRALPSSQLYLSSTDMAGDTQLVSCGTGTCFNTRTVPVSSFASAPSNDPLDPHIQHTTGLPGNTPYTIQSYLTQDPTDPVHVLVATVQVSWSNSQLGGVANKVQVESKIYDAEFNEAAPSIHHFSASASATPGSITVNGTILSNPLVNLALNMPSVSAGMNGTSIPNTTDVGTGSGVTSVTGSVAQSNISVGTTTLLNSNAVSESASSAAGGSYNLSPVGTTTPTLAGGPSTSLTAIVANVQAQATGGPSTSTQAVAASAAAGQSGISNGTSPLPVTSNGLGFGQSVASQSGTIEADLQLLNLLGTPTATVPLVELAPTGNSSGTATTDSATVSQQGTSSAPQSQTFNATVSQSFSTIKLLQLPGLSPLVNLTGFLQTANACAAPPGISCTQPGVTDTGSLSILGGPPITIQTLLNATQPVLTALDNLLTQNISVSLLGLPIASIGVTGNIGVGLASTTSPGSESVPSPITITLSVKVASILTGSILNLAIGLNLGSVSATASYTS